LSITFNIGMMIDGTTWIVCAAIENDKERHLRNEALHRRTIRSAVGWSFTAERLVIEQNSTGGS
jgi:hypothetical protein